MAQFKLSANCPKNINTNGATVCVSIKTSARTKKQALRNKPIPQMTGWIKGNLLIIASPRAVPSGTPIIPAVMAMTPKVNETLHTAKGRKGDINLQSALTNWT